MPHRHNGASVSARVCPNLGSEYATRGATAAPFLFRVTTDAQADMTFGDEDPLDFYVPKRGLANADFRKGYAYCGD